MTSTWHCLCLHLSAGQLPSTWGKPVHAMLGVMYSAAANLCSLCLLLVMKLAVLSISW